MLRNCISHTAKMRQNQFPSKISRPALLLGTLVLAVRFERGFGGYCPPLIPRRPQVSLEKAKVGEGNWGLVLGLLTVSTASRRPFLQPSGSK